MALIELPEWLLSPLFGAAEGDGEEGESEGSSNDGGDSEDDDEHGEGSGQGGEGSEEKSDGALSALRKERKARKDAERELRQLRADKQKREQEESDKKLAEEDAVKAAETKAQRAEERARVLAERLRDRTVDALIRDAARDLNFHDVQDALLRIDRSTISVEQDESDPTDVEVDEDTVKKAVKALADKHKHLVNVEGSGTRSGGSFRDRHKSGEGEDKGPASRFRI